MKKYMLSPLAFVLIALTIPFMVSCYDDAQIASNNLSRAADNFEIPRRVVFYNGFNSEYILVIEGLCSIEDDPRARQLEVTCKTGDRQYVKHFLGLSDNVTYFAQQLSPARVSVYHHRVTFKPQSILPDVDFRGSAEELLENASEFNQQSSPSTPSSTGVVPNDD